jgi:hypothetical protein
MSSDECYSNVGKRLLNPVVGDKGISAQSVFASGGSSIDFTDDVQEALDRLSNRAKSYEGKLREMIIMLETMLPDEIVAFNKNSAQFSHVDLLMVLRQQLVIKVLGAEK